jgi:hypothetical protein
MNNNMDVLKKWSEKFFGMGYAPTFYEEDGELIEQLDCIIDGVNFGIGPDDEEDALWFSIIFEPERDIDADEMAKICSMNKGVFEDVIDAGDGTVHVLVKTDLDVSLDFANEIIASIKDENGVVQYLKSISYVW